MFCGPMWGSWGVWGMPWIMFLMPLLFLAVMFLACRFFRPRFAGWCGHRLPADGILAEGIKSMRREVEELRKEIRDGK